MGDFGEQSFWRGLVVGVAVMWFVFALVFLDD